MQGSIKKIHSMEKVFYIKKKMATMKEIFQMENTIKKECTSTKMEVYTMDSSTKVTFMEKGKSFGKKALFMKVISQTIALWANHENGIFNGK